MFEQWFCISCGMQCEFLCNKKFDRLLLNVGHDLPEFIQEMDILGEDGQWRKWLPIWMIPQNSQL